MRVQEARVGNLADIRCVVLASLARIVDCSTAMADCRTDDSPGLRKVRSAIDEALTAGIAHIEVALTIGDAPFDVFLARHETIAAQTAKVVARTLRSLLTRSGIASDRVRFVNDGAPTSAQNLHGRRSASPPFEHVLHPASLSDQKIIERPDPG